MTSKQGNAILRAGVSLAALFFFASCSSNAVGPGTPPPVAVAQRSPIKHVVFIIQENRSFNNLFMGFPGATTQDFGYDMRGRRIALQPLHLGTVWDISHGADAFFAACDGRGALPGTDCRMDGWNREQVFLSHPPHAAYSYVPRSEIEPYWQLARKYVLADHMFASNLDASFVAHQYTIAAYASRSVGGPSTAWGCSGGKFDTVLTLTKRRGYGPRIPACFDDPTVGSEADRAGISWRFYAGALNDDGGSWSAYQANRRIFYGGDWKDNVISPSSRFIRDVAKGKLAGITWITPIWENSDHAGLWSTGGPAWVASLVDAVGTSKFWDSTAIFIMWDDWGGFYDPVPPVYKDYDGLGFRVPLLIVSPYAKRGYVTHVQYETASVLRFVEDNFGLRQLAASDSRANDPVSDAFDYTRAPRAFERVAGSRPLSHWIDVEQTSTVRDGIPIVTDGD